MIYAVIPTGNRPAEYKNVFDWCIAHGVTPITIVTSDEAMDYAQGRIIRDATLNISRWWNLGLQLAYKDKVEHVLVLNDDVVLPGAWLPRIVEALEAGYFGASGTRGVDKITGYAFGLNGKSHILADENLVWWYGDDDIQKKCDAAGGFVTLSGIDVENKYANSSYDRFSQQIAKDKGYFLDKWHLNDY